MSLVFSQDSSVPMLLTSVKKFGQSSATTIFVLLLPGRNTMKQRQSTLRLKLQCRYAANSEALSGIPSIIYGLVGMLMFSNNFGTCLLAGALTLAIMNLPTIMRNTQESLKTVPQSYREGAFGLGAGKWRVIRTVVLPNCLDGVVTGCILSVGRILGESAALLFTAGFAHSMNDFVEGLSSAGASLTVALYVYAKEDGEFGVAFGIAAILMVLAFCINMAASAVTKHFQKKNAV